jgi:hypothetical protein
MNKKTVARAGLVLALAIFTVHGQVAHRELLPESIHVTDQYANNRAEQWPHDGSRKLCAWWS